MISAILFSLPLLLTRTVLSHPECSPDLMTSCIDPLALLADKPDLVLGSSMEKLQSMCPKLMDGLSCINTFTVRCLETEQRNHFNILYSGIIQVIEDLCRPGPYQSDYLRHSACMSEVQPEYQECSAEYQDRLRQVQQHDTAASHNSDQEVAVLCCSFQSYLACSQGVVNKTCGRETADFTAQFLDRMAAPLAQGHCHTFTPGSLTCLDLALNIATTSVHVSCSTILNLSFILLLTSLLY